MRVTHIAHCKAKQSGHNAISHIVHHLNRQERTQAAESEIWSLVNDVHMVDVTTYEIGTRLYRKI